MVKIPGMKDIKKFSTGIAKTATSSSIIDKLKNSVDSLATGSSDKHEAYQKTGDPIKDGIAHCYKLIAELQEVNRIQANLLNNLDKGFDLLSKAAANESNTDVPKEDSAE